MEAPKPKKNKYEYEIKSEEDIYKFELSCSSNALLISCYEIKTIPKITFEQTFTLEQFQKTHKFFKMYDTIEESIPDIISIFEEKKVKIIPETNYISIILTLPVKQNDEFILNLPQVEINQENLVSNLLSVVQNMNKKIEKLSYDLELIKSIPSIQKELLKMANSLIGDIIKEKKDEEWLIEQVINVLNYEKCYKPTILFLYKATEDGDDYSNFHLNCDNYNNTLVIIESNNGNIFGGFTTQMWNSSSNKNKDEVSFKFYNNRNRIQSFQKKQENNNQDKYFLFNLNKKIILYGNQNGKGICNNSSYPFIFGTTNCYELYATNGFLSNGGISEYSTFYNDNNYSISGGSEFSIKDVEVYQFN